MPGYRPARKAPGSQLAACAEHMRPACTKRQAVQRCVFVLPKNAVHFHLRNWHDHGALARPTDGRMSAMLADLRKVHVHASMRR